MRAVQSAPMAGHFATLLRNTVQTLLIDHDVYITDWKSARDVPLSAGRFGTDEFRRAFDRPNGRVAGRYDATMMGPDPFPDSGDSHFGDPSETALYAPLTSAAIDLTRNTLKWRPDGTYHLLNRSVAGAWDFGRGREPVGDTAPQIFIEIADWPDARQQHCALAGFAQQDFGEHPRGAAGGCLRPPDSRWDGVGSTATMSRCAPAHIARKAMTRNRRAPDSPSARIDSRWITERPSSPRPAWGTA